MIPPPEQPHERRYRPRGRRRHIRWGVLSYFALMAFCALGSMHRGRFDGLGLLVLVGCGVGVFVLLLLAAGEDIDQ